MSLTVAEALFQTSFQLHDESTLKSMLLSLLKCDESNHRTLQLLATVLVRMGQGHEIERYSKRFVILQLKRGNVSDAHDELKEMIAYDGPYVLDVEVPYQEHVLPMIPAGMTVKDLIKE
jgi:hypothetical protein